MDSKLVEEKEISEVLDATLPDGLWGMVGDSDRCRPG